MTHKIARFLMGLFCLGLLSACSSSADAPQEAEAFRAFISEKSSATMEAVVSADYGDRVYDFTLRYDYLRDGKSTIEIMEPEPVRGIRATIEAGQTQLEYDGMILDTGALPGTGLSPVDVLPTMLKTWSEGYLDSAGKESLDGRDVLHFVFTSTVSEVSIEQHVWVEQESFTPVRAEMMADGTRVLSVLFSQVVFL